MCGINFILDKQKRLDPSAILRMNEAIRHRGREHSSWHSVGGQARCMYFGHNRLKIIDLQDSANQPLCSPDGRYTLIFNGEIYNYKALRKTLQAKYTFVTQSDSEVLMYFLAEGQARNLAELNGIFAFVWYDAHTDTLLYARDSFGTKPLYKYEDERYLILSSEIRGVLASDLVDKAIDETQIYHYLAYRYAEPTKTFFKSIVPVPVFSAPTSPKNTSKTLLHTLESALERQTVGDVPFGIFLSGGVDSTLLLGLLHRLGYKHLPAFTIANKAQERNFGTADFHFARLASAQFEADLQVLEVDSGMLQDLPAFVESADQPIADGAYWLTQMLAKEARKSVKFVLSGAGADELFAGYHRHQAYQTYLHYYPFLMLAYPLLKGLGKALPTGFAHPYRKYFRLIRKFTESLSTSKSATWLNFVRLHNIPTKMTDAPFSGSCLAHDQRYYLQNDILALTDRASMWHELEVRVPYLDNEIVEYATQTTLACHLKYGKKWELKQILTDLGGKIYTQRRKEGFGMPIGKWLRESAGKPYIAMLQNPQNNLSHYLPARYAQNLVRQHLTQKSDYSSELWALLFLELWLNRV